MLISCPKGSQLELYEFNPNCDEYIDKFYFKENTKNCYNIYFLGRGYYFDDFTINERENPDFKKCYENWKMWLTQWYVITWVAFYAKMIFIKFLEILFLNINNKNLYYHHYIIIIFG